MKKNSNSEKDIDFKKEITFSDVKEVVENFERTYPKRYGVSQNILDLIKAIFSIYSEHIEKQKNKNINLGLEKNRPEVLRSELIRRYRRQEPSEDLEEKFYTDKSRVNEKLIKMIFDAENGRSLNPKCLVVKMAKSMEGEKSNYFVAIRKPEIAPAQAIGYNYSIDQRLKTNLDKWKSSNYLGEHTLSNTDLSEICTEMILSELDDESIAYLMISAIFRHKYEEWWPRCKNNETVIWHMINLLPQVYRRPFWRVSFILQCADPKMLSKAVAKIPKAILITPQVKQALNHVRKKTVHNFMLKCIEEKSFLVEPYATQLLREFLDFNCRKLEKQ